MFNHPLTIAVGNWFRPFSRTIQRLTNTIAAWLLRQLFSLRLYPNQTGFVLPTTVLLVLVVSLAVGTISLRTFQRTTQVVGAREQRVIYNIATPALDRARAKFEYLFQGDPRFPAGIPSEGVMNALLLDGRNLLPGVTDAYVLADEIPLDLDGDGATDAAWSYRTDTDDDGVDDATVAYSIILQTPRVGDPYQMVDASDGAIEGRADALQVRNAPLSGSRQLIAACQLNDASVPLEQGWFKDEASSATLRKNLQVDVYVQPDNPTQTLATLEFQQDRQLDQGNKWGAWFRSDLDITPGPIFNWNGAMHTEGTLTVGTGSSSGNRRFTGYLVSSPNSCIYTADASEITVANVDADTSQGIPEFRGQVIGSRGSATRFGSDESIFHLHDNPVITTGDTQVLLDKTKDSVKNDQGYGPSDFTLDPLVLATEGVSQSRDASINYSTTYDQTAWESNPINQHSRIYAQSEDPPYLDDFFRADDRFGPKPRYGDVLIPSTKTIGDEITGNLLSRDGLSDVTLTREDAASDDAAGVGLDGYWERRARQAGLRLIIGQRLELGNAFGWGGWDASGQRQAGTADPLNPWAGCVGSNNTNRCNEARHRLTLRDNLAAVQATAVYHAAAGTTDNDTPLACLATTVHPGTPETLQKSAIFKDLSAGVGNFWTGSWFDGKPLISDFFTGEGTNGWEYEVHPKSAIDANSDVTIQALQNLAYYAGDPKGGAPSFPPVQDATVHPYPDMAMWGDFSVLRRIFDQLWSGGGYDSLSIADKSTLRSAACTVGMLAYNIGYLNNLDYAKDTPKINDLVTAINNISGVSADARPEEVIAQLPADQQPLAQLVMVAEQVERDRLYGFQDGLRGANDDFDSGGYSGGNNWSNHWTITATNNGTASDVSITSGALQIRDDGLQVSRTLDLSGLTNPTLSFDYRRDSLDWDGEYVKLEISTDGTNFTELDRFRGPISDSSDQSFSIDVSSYVSPTTTIRFVSSDNLSDWDRFWVDNVSVGAPFSSNDCRSWTNGLERLCTDYPKYPILNALFPFSAHDEVAKSGSTTMATRDGAIPAYIQTENANTAIQYRAIDLTQSTVLNAIALEPKALNQWTLPHGTLSNGTNPNSNVELTIACEGTVCGSGGGNKEFEVAFKDTALMNSREKMAVRLLNLNLDLMRTSTSNLSGDHWLPDSGLIYAFREDAVREDEIVRPSRDTWANCNQNSKYEVDSNCRMAINADAYASTDPPLDTANLISPKPVDYYADPDRRPYGFRLIHGARVDRGTHPRGLSLISDNPVYIQGDFNLHQSSGCGTDACRLEEFTTKLDDATFNNFYTRTTLDTRFARPNHDLWRPSEILTDAITILSDNFCDGSFADGWLTAGEGTSVAVTDASGEEGISTTNDYGCTGGSGSGDRTSFLNAMRPEVAPSSSPSSGWQRENPGDTTAPIVVSRNGNPITSAGTDYASSYYDSSDFIGQTNRISGAISEQDTRVNAVMISGVVPMRSNQGYGGLHNFPRFISQWSTADFGTRQALNIAGAFLQLNYSNYATGPFDQDAFETTQDASTTLLIPYYIPPKRLWGYDVGLQYAQAGPIAQRFVAASAVRSEFYSEPGADDPYMVNLCRAMVTTAGGDPDTACAS